MKLKKFLAGWYRLENADGFFSNIRHHERGEHKGMWTADIRQPSGDLRQYAGVWKTRRDAVAEATSILERI